MLLFHTLNNKGIWGGISQYQRKQHWGPLMYLTYFTPPSVISGSRTAVCVGRLTHSLLNLPWESW